MAGLFDFIKSAMVLAGGSRMARQEEEDLKSQIEHRKETINVQREGTEAQKEIAASQRELTEKLQGREQVHQKEMKTTEIDWEKERLKKEQEFQKSENQFTRTHAKELAQLEIDARAALQGKAILSQEKIAQNENDLRWRIALLDKKLREMGFTLERDKMVKDLSIEKMQILIKAVDIATRSTTGMEGLMTAATGTGEMKTLLDAKQNQILKTTLKAIDPDGKLGVRDINISDYVISGPVSDKAASEARNILGGMGAVVPGVTPKSTPSPKPVDNTPIISPRVLDEVAPPPIPSGRLSLDSSFSGLNPADVLGLDRVAFEIQRLPEAERPTAFREYQSIIEDPTFMPAGDNRGDLNYRKMMTGYLQKSTGFDFSK